MAELRPLKKINDNYEKIILTSDKIPVFNEDEIKIRNVLFHHSRFKYKKCKKSTKITFKKYKNI